MLLLLTCALLAFILLLSEYLWRYRGVRGEYGRKFVHILMGSFVALWPYYLSKQSITLLSCIALLGMLVSRYTNFLRAIHDVRRLTVGEFAAPLGVIMAAWMALEPWVFATAILFVALADGMAAVVGKKWGKRRLPIKAFGLCKTFAGSGAYIIFAIGSVSIGALLGGYHTMLLAPFAVFVALPLLAAGMEAVSPYGVDNITVPLLIVGVLNLLVQTGL